VNWLDQNNKGIIMKWTTLSFKQLAQQKTLRLDAKYWLKRQASSCKRQATSLPQSCGTAAGKQKGIK
jgi:hypothetical protein